MLRTLFTLGLAASAAATAGAVVFEPYNNFPQPAPAAFGVTAAALPDGRFLAWNGDTVFLQFAPDTDAFHPVATGYAGDPGFIALAPDGQSAVLGAGFSGDLYSFSVAAPQDFTPASVIANEPHYSGTFLTPTLLLVDAGQPAFAGSELRILDLSGNKGATPVTVLSVPGSEDNKDLIVEKPPFTYSAVLGIDESAGIVYTMSTFGVPEELRYFTIADILSAYATATPLDWATDGVLVGASGQFNDGGVAGILPNGDLVMPGNGSIQIVDPRLDDPGLATVVDTFDPSGQGGFYSVYYNPYTDVILAWDGATAYAPAGTVKTVPALGAAGLLLLCGGIGTLAFRRRKH